MGWTLFALLGGLALLVGGAVAFFSLKEDERPAAFFVAAFAALPLALLRYRLTLDDDFLEERGIFRTRRIARANVTGFRIIPTKYVETLELRSSALGEKPFRFARVYRTDEAFDAWLASLRNLDEESRARILSEVQAASDPIALGRARRIAKALNALAVTVCAWVLFFPRPYRFAVVAAIVVPLIGAAITVRGRGLYAADKRRDDPRPSLITALILPGLTLTLRVTFDINFVDYRAPVVFGVVLGCAMGTAFVLADPQVRRRGLMILLMGLFCSAWGFGAVGEVNVAFDTSPPIDFTATLLDKRESHGNSTSYTLILSPWSERSEPDEINVPRSTYERARVGQAVRVRMRAGRFRIPWYYVLVP